MTTRDVVGPVVSDGFRSGGLVPAPLARRRTSGPANGIVASVLWLVLSALLPLMAVLRSGTGSARSSAWVVSVGIAVWAGHRLSQLATRGRPNLFAGAFWTYTYIFMGLAPTVQIVTGSMPITTPDISPSGDLGTMLLIGSGVLCFDFGYQYGARRPSKSHRSRMSPFRKRSARGSSSAALLAVVCVGSLFALLWVSSVGLEVLFASRDERAITAEETFSTSWSRVLFSLLAWVPLSIATACLLARAQSRSSRIGLGQRLLLLVGLVGTFIVNNPVSGPRYYVGSMVFCYAAASGLVRSRRGCRALILGLLVAMLAVFPVADYFRRADPDSRQASLALLSEYEGNGDYDSFAQVSNARRVTAESGFTFGRQALGLVSFWVPRSVWADKPTDTGMYISEGRGYDYTNLSAPLWAEFYVNLGTPAVLIGFVGVGRVVQRADRSLVRKSAEGSSDSSFVALCFMSIYMIILLRGSLMQAMSIPAVVVGTVFVLDRLGGMAARPAETVG